MKFVSIMFDQVLKDEINHGKGKQSRRNRNLGWDKISKQNNFKTQDSSLYIVVIF